MIHTPVKKSSTEKSPRITPTPPKQTEMAGPSPKSKNETSQVRRSIGEWETKGPGRRQVDTTPPTMTAAPVGSKQKDNKGVTRRVSAEAPGELNATKKEQPKPTDRVTQARTWLRKAKAHLTESRNLKTELKAGITLALDEIYKLLREEAGENKGLGMVSTQEENYSKNRTDKAEKETNTQGGEKSTENRDVIQMLEWQKQKIEETHVEIGRLREAVMTLQSTSQSQTMTYAEATSAAANHSVVERRTG